MQKHLIIVAGGSGTRMQSDIPKQFIALNELPIIMHTINKFVSFDNTINLVVVLNNQYIDFWKSLCHKHGFSYKHTIANGGKTRFESVKNGLNQINDNGLVAIHDAIRPFVSIETISRCFNNALEKGNAVPCLALKESIRQIEEDKTYCVNRENYKIIQTPQVFEIDPLKLAYNADYKDFFTDDASVFESNGNCINLVDGNQENIKITTKFDLKIAEILIND